MDNLYLAGSVPVGSRQNQNHVNRAVVKFVLVFFFRQVLIFLRTGFPSYPTWLISTILLVVLDLASFIGLIWHFFIRGAMPIPPVLLVRISFIHLGLTMILAVLAFVFGRLTSIRVVTLFYGSVGLFFLSSGVMESSGREFSIWPWVIVWVVALAITVKHFNEEFEGEKNTP